MEFTLDHVAIAVPSINAALPLFERLVGATSSPVERVESQQVEVAFLGSEGTCIELLQPTAADSAVQRFLEKRGPGLHHIALRVPNIDAELVRLAAAGFRLIDERARPGARGHRVAFLHPQSTGGVLVELVQP